ncbi:DUF2635 domain-containing protein [Citrobacter sp. wls829]|uniref:DUF2635 domain-containing protein n=1 Tax=Citrobacter sp. wls829 TaxID=2576412 RepID=UPI0010C96DF9|nr:DUF2635 domain-containing protein [Citrobacter sp. wls829]TKU09607.1 DUF2635 domain-containing protein [Citrobacter sp. wls829]
MFVKPKDGRSVHDPARGDLLPAAGRNVEPSQYWYRRENDGDIEVVTPSQGVAPDKKVSTK